MDGSVKKLVKKQLDKLKTSPLLGEELGNKNGYDLSGYRKMYACKKQIRIVYSVVENVLLVNISFNIQIKGMWFWISMRSDG